MIKQDSCPAIWNVSVLDANIHTRKKLSKVQDFQSFDVVPKTLDFIQDYWMEDISLVEEFKRLNEDDYLVELNGLGTCVDIFKNPGVKIQKGLLCNEPGFCQV